MTHTHHPLMRAKLVVQGITQYPTQTEGAAPVTQETVRMNAVCKPGGYPEDGSDEDNTFAKFSPSASFEIAIMNPVLLGKFRAGQKFYVDFTEVPEAEAPTA